MTFFYWNKAVKEKSWSQFCWICITLTCFTETLPTVDGGQVLVNDKKTKKKNSLPVPRLSDV